MQHLIAMQNVAVPLPLPPPMPHLLPSISRRLCSAAVSMRGSTSWWNTSRRAALPR